MGHRDSSSGWKWSPVIGDELEREVRSIEIKCLNYSIQDNGWPCVYTASMNQYQIIILLTHCRLNSITADTFKSVSLDFHPCLKKSIYELQFDIANLD